MSYKLPSLQVFLGTVSGLIGAALTIWVWNKSRIVHNQWEDFATVPYEDATAWIEGLETVRFSFGVLHQLSSAIVITAIVSALAASSECARQMPPVTWDKPKD